MNMGIQLTYTTMHSHNTYYYHCFNIMDRNWDCECDDVTPYPEAVRKHVLHLCPLYTEECNFSLIWYQDYTRL